VLRKGPQMNLGELIRHQKEWEQERGLDLVNVGYNLPRAQVEMDEAFEETNPLGKLIEMCDVIIVLSGGMAKLLDELGLEPEDADRMIERKLEINELKYDTEIFAAHQMMDALTRVRHYWNVDPGEWEVDGDIY